MKREKWMAREVRRANKIKYLEDKATIEAVRARFIKPEIHWAELLREKLELNATRTGRFSYGRRDH